MIGAQSNGSLYKVIISVAMAARLKEVQRQAKASGLGAESLAAVKTMYHWLQHDPLEFGEPLYHLYVLKLQVRTGVIWPLAVDYAVHQKEPLVFIKGVRLLSESDATE